MTSEQQYSDKNVGENPIPAWPADAIGLPKTWGADEIVEEIEDCRGCGDEGLCRRHRGMTEGYDTGRRDIWRAMRYVGVLEEFNEEVRNNGKD